MEKSTKIILTIVLVVVCIVIFAAISGMRSAAGNSTPGILGLIVVAGTIGGIKAIWKKSDNE